MISGGCATVDLPDRDRARLARVRRESISDEAARWLAALKSGDETVRAEFANWVRRSPRHFSAFLRASAEEFECVEDFENVGVTNLIETVAERRKLQNRLYVLYRRPLLQVFYHRRIDRDTA